MTKPRTTLCALVILITAVQTFGQTLDDVRDQLREALHNSHFAAGFAGLIVLTDELELSGARYEVDDADSYSSNSEIRSFAIPFRKRFHPRDDTRTGIYTEGVIGYTKASESTSDLYSGTIPALVTSVDSEWTTIGGLIGVGPEYKVTEELTITPIVNAGMAYIRSDADYGGPGAPVSAAIYDGLAFNWDGWTVSGGGAIRADWTRPLGKGYNLELVGRYDIRWTETLHSDDSAQEFSNRYQLFTLRSDVVGPTGLTFFDRTLYWRALAGYRNFQEGDLYGSQHIVLLGAGLEYDITGILPIGSRLTVKGGLMAGDDISGYTIGMGFTF